MNFDTALDDIDTVLAEIRLGLNGEPVANEFADIGGDDNYFMGAMDVYEAIDHVMDQLSRMKNEIIRKHVVLLESQLQRHIE